MLKNMKISMSHTVSSERTCRLPACYCCCYHRHHLFRSRYNKPYSMSTHEQDRQGYNLSQLPYRNQEQIKTNDILWKR